MENSEEAGVLVSAYISLHCITMNKNPKQSSARCKNILSQRSKKEIQKPIL